MDFEHVANGRRFTVALQFVANIPGYAWHAAEQRESETFSSGQRIYGTRDEARAAAVACLEAATARDAAVVSETRRCNWCEGGKRVIYGRSGDSVVDLLDCEDCGGTGRVPRWKYCDHCGNVLMGMEQASDTCNACLDTGRPHPVECECDACKKAFQDSLWSWLTPEIAAVCERANRTGDIPLSMQ